jgi:hypothetical protein
MQIRVKRGIYTAILVAICVTALVVVRSYVFNRVKETVQKKLEALNKTDFHIQYDTVYINWKKNLIVIDKLVIQKDVYDTTCLYPEFISIRQVRAEGFSLIQFLLKKTLTFESVHIQNPHIAIREHSSLLKDSAASIQNEMLFKVGQVHFTSAHFEFADSASCKLITGVKMDIKAVDVSLGLFKNKPLAIAAKRVRFDSTVINMPQDFYEYRINGANIDFAQGELHMDTLHIIPMLSKIEFGKKAGREIDRIEGVVPFIKLSGFTHTVNDTLSLKIKKANIQMFLKIFRDKRLTHLKKYKPLPVQQVLRIPFGLNIDTLSIIKSYVEYEEFPEHGEMQGKVFFDNLTGTVSNISNNLQGGNGATILKARAALMGHGELKVHTVFPWQPGKKSVTNGSLTDFPIPKMNSMLESAANIKVESGDLNSLTFHFAYNDTRSDGEIELNYNDLKIISFKDEEKLKKQEKKKNRKNRDPEDDRQDNLKTFIINAFLVRKNMDGRVPQEKRTGTVMFYRDTSRSIFNFWWKSLLSGIKSAYNLDKFAEMAKRKEKRRNRKDRG